MAGYLIRCNEIIRMRRKDKEITDRTEIDAIIRRASVCRLALADQNQPYIIPLCFGYRENTLYFHSARSGKKLDILKKNNRVCFEFDIDCDTIKSDKACDWGMKYKSVVGFGTASLVEGFDLKCRALDIIMHQYSDRSFEYPETKVKNTVVIQVEIAHMTGKASGVKMPDSTKETTEKIDAGAQPDDESVLKNIKKMAKNMLDNARGSHDWEHTLRVYRLCERMGPAENADMDVLRIAAYLHDIGRSFQDASDGAVCHAEKGAQMAWPMVKDLSLKETQKQNIIHCIKSHRFRGNHLPETKEAKVLFDADKLDAIGAVGVARAYLFAGEVGARLHNSDINVEKTRPYSKEDTGFREFKVKLCKIRDRILTHEGKRLAKERHGFMEQFFRRFIQEVEGER